ncbi:MAG: succinate dehydrogenase hydrophobic rane anchor protein [Chloroflexi bacterium]|jgi:succinate dehydrogenase / fumarate reductase membrane anchor subunit|nr:succinate dehydrogenase hydrophobic rane anchor protein [Chloroflexota bacterium]
MASVTRAGRARPTSGGLELAVWYLIRLTGLGLFVLALSHFLITHVVYDPVEQTGEWIVEERWGSLLWRTVDWLMLSMVIFHSFMGVRTVLRDYTGGMLRAALTMTLYLVGIVLFALGTMAVATMSAPVP